ncbi:hypothetical protein PMAYCL1PPCAC_00884, partial [Pristionchus mayeri]
QVMRKEKNQRRFHHYVCQTGPSYIRKDTIAFDSCDVYPIRHEGSVEKMLATLAGMSPQTRKTWEEGMTRFDNSAVFRPDPFGINDYGVNFSLNKKNRWEINEEIADRIEDVQDPHKKLRVSATLHTQDVTKSGYFFSGTPRDLPCSEYHSVTRDGVVTHRTSTKGKTRLRNFSHPESRPTRVRSGPRPDRYFEKGDWREDSDLPVDENSQYQKVHVHYTTTRLTSNPSIHNKASHRSIKYAMKPYGSEFKYARNSRIVEELSDSKPDREESDVSEESDFVVVDRRGIPNVVDLSQLVVRKSKKGKVGNDEYIVV